MYFSKNLKHLRKNNNRQTQESLAQTLGLTRSVISSYEDGRAEPSISTLRKISEYFNVSIENLTNLDLKNVDQEKVEHQRKLKDYASARNLEVHTSKVDNVKNLQFNLVPEKASAGYTSGYASMAYLSDLPSYQMPFLARNKKYRAFEISGDSMLPLKDKSIVIGEYLESIDDVKDGQVCIVISKTDGIVLKKVFNKIEERGTLLLKSSNISYSPYEIKKDEVIELWRFTAYISHEFPENYDDTQDLKHAFARLEGEIQNLKSHQNKNPEDN